MDAEDLRKSDKYKYVWLCRIGKKNKWRGKRFTNGKYFDNERDAALYVDRQCIEKGKDPVNILVRK